MLSLSLALSHALTNCLFVCQFNAWFIPNWILSHRSSSPSEDKKTLIRWKILTNLACQFNSSEISIHFFNFKHLEFKIRLNLTLSDEIALKIVLQCVTLATGLKFRGKMGKEKLSTFFGVVVIDFFPSTFRTVFTFIFLPSKFHFIRIKLSFKNQTPIEWTIFHLPNEYLLRKKIRFSDLFTLLSLCLFDDAKPLGIKRISIHTVTEVVGAYAHSCQHRWLPYRPMHCYSKRHFTNYSSFERHLLKVELKCSSQSDAMEIQRDGKTSRLFVGIQNFHQKWNCSCQHLF